MNARHKEPHEMDHAEFEAYCDWTPLKTSQQATSRGANPLESLGPPRSQNGFLEVSDSICGLPLPPQSAPVEEVHKWLAASMFISSCDGARSAEEGTVDAGNFALQEAPELVPNLQPHLERTLGRALTKEEIKARRIEAV